MQHARHTSSIAAALCLVLALAGCGSAPTPTLTADSEHSCAESAYFQITNTSAREVRFAGWTLRDDRGEHILPTRLLAPQATLRIWRGRGLEDATNIYLAQPIATWRLANAARITLGSPPARWPWETFQTFFLECTVSLPM